MCMLMDSLNIIYKLKLNQFTVTYAYLMIKESLLKQLVVIIYVLNVIWIYKIIINIFVVQYVKKKIG